MATKTKIWLIAILSIVILGAIFIPLTFFVFLKTPTPRTPDAPTFVLTETKIFAETNEIEGAKHYIFKFKTPTNNSIEILSATPSVYVDMFDLEKNQYVSGFENAGIYEITVCAVGESEKSQSSYSEKTLFERYIKLKQPTVNYYHSNNQLMLQWQKVEKTTSYELYITSINQETKTVKLEPSLFGEFETVNLDTIIKNLNIPFGDYQVSIIARNTTSTFYIESFFSNPISFNYKE